MPIKKQKKITVKFFLNKLLEPIWITDNKKPHYPLYVQVTYDRKNTQLKSKYGWYYVDMKDVEADLLNFEEKILKKVISYETNRSNKEYELKGLKQKYEIYSKYIIVASDEYLMPHLKKEILKTDNEFSKILNYDSVYADVKLIYKAAKLLIKDFDNKIDGELLRDLKRHFYYMDLFDYNKLDYQYATIIDWVDGTHSTELKKLLEIKYKRKPEIVSEVLSYVDDLVKECIKKIS